MPQPALPSLVEEALRDLAPYDASQAMESHVREHLPQLKKTARLRSRGVVSRAQLGLVIAGDPAARLALADAYTKALHGYEITTGRDDDSGPVMKSVQWGDIIADESGNPLPFGKALDKLYAAKSEAEGGVLVIENIYDLPPHAANATAVSQAQNGAYQMLHDLMTEFAEKNYTPVVVLAGDDGKMQDFLKKNRAVSEYFTAPAIHASTPALPPPPPVSIETDHRVTVSRPLKLKKPGL